MSPLSRPLRPRQMLLLLLLLLSTNTLTAATAVHLLVPRARVAVTVLILSAAVCSVVAAVVLAGDVRSAEEGWVEEEEEEGGVRRQVQGREQVDVERLRPDVYDGCICNEDEDAVGDITIGYDSSSSGSGGWYTCSEGSSGSGSSGVWSPVPWPCGGGRISGIALGE